MRKPRDKKRKASKILRLAAERIRYGRFTQRDFYDERKFEELGPDEVPVCAWGAIKWAAYGTPQVKTESGSSSAAALYYTEMKLTDGHYGWCYSLPSFNDSHTMTEVRKLLLDAADLAEAEGN